MHVHNPYCCISSSQRIPYISSTIKFCTKSLNNKLIPKWEIDYRLFEVRLKPRSHQVYVRSWDYDDPPSCFFSFFEREGHVVTPNRLKSWALLSATHALSRWNAMSVVGSTDPRHGFSSSYLPVGPLITAAYRFPHVRSRYFIGACVLLHD